MTTPHDPWWDGSAAEPSGDGAAPPVDGTPPAAAADDPAADENVASAASPSESADGQPATVKPAAAEPTVIEPAVIEPAALDQASDEPAFAEPAAAAAEPTPADLALSPPPAGTTPETAGPASPACSRRDLVALVAALVVVSLLAAGVALLGLRLRDAQRTETAREQAVAASRDAARLLFSYDHSTLEADFARGLAVTTGEFRDEYTKTTRDVVADVAKEYKAVVLADVVESAVVDADPDEVTTIVFLNQATTSTRVEGQQVDASRVRMTLVDRDGRWLVSKVEAL